MSRLFKSNWGVAILVCCAVYVVIRNVALPFMAHQEIDNEIPFLEAYESELDIANDIHSLKSVDVSMLYWNDSPSRDPFGQKRSIEKGQITEVEKIRDQREAQTSSSSNSSNTSIDKAIVKIDYKPVPKISGFVAGTESRFAVLNNRLVTEGQSIDEYLVLAITQEGVNLRHPDGSSSITLTVKP